MKPLSPSDLAQFTGSTQWFRHSFNRAVIYTEGVQFLAERGGAFWLIDAIASHIGGKRFREAVAKDERIELLHFWNLAVRPNQYGILTAVPDQGEPAFITQDFPYTDFPLSSVDIWAQHNGEGFTLMLPSEY